MTHLRRLQMRRRLRRPSRPAQRTPAVSKIEIDDHFSANPLRELCNLGKGLLAFGVLRNGCLRLLIGRLVGVLHNDEPVSGIWAGLKAAQPIGDPVFEIDGLQLLGQGTSSMVPPR
jgi:hypothetical protein